MILRLNTPVFILASCFTVQSSLSVLCDFTLPGSRVRIDVGAKAADLQLPSPLHGVGPRLLWQLLNKISCLQKETCLFFHRAHKMKRQTPLLSRGKGTLHSFCSSVILWQVDNLNSLLTNPSCKNSGVSK